MDTTCLSPSLSQPEWGGVAGSHLPPLAPGTLAGHHLVLPALAEGLLTVVQLHGGHSPGPPSLPTALQATLLLGYAVTTWVGTRAAPSFPVAQPVPFCDLMHLPFPRWITAALTGWVSRC